MTLYILQNRYQSSPTDIEIKFLNFIEINKIQE